MKTLILAGVVVLFSASAASAQVESDTTTLYRNGVPISEDDTVKNFPATDIEPLSSYRELKSSEVPKAIQKAIDDNNELKDWSEPKVFYDSLNERYMVYLRKKQVTRIYGMNKSGKTVTFDEQIDQ